MKIVEPSPDSPTWPIVLQFAKLMELKLSLNRHKGDRSEWLKDDAHHLKLRILEEYVELERAMESLHPWEYAAFECADIANFAMMVADASTGGAFLDPKLSSDATCAAMGIAARNSERLPDQALGSSVVNSVEGEPSARPCTGVNPVVEGNQTLITTQIAQGPSTTAEKVATPKPEVCEHPSELKALTEQGPEVEDRGQRK